MLLGQCHRARTDAVPLVSSQLESWATLTGHTPFGCLFADVGAAVLLIHTVEALWNRKREKIHNETLLQWLSSCTQRHTH